MRQRTLSEQEQIRRNALEEIKQLGIEPYPAETFEVNTTAAEITESFSENEAAFQNVNLAGRMMARRIMGNASFAEIQDHTLYRSNTIPVM